MVLCLCFKATRKCFNTWVGLRQCLLLLFLLLLFDTVCKLYNNNARGEKVLLRQFPKFHFLAT